MVIILQLFQLFQHDIACTCMVYFVGVCFAFYFAANLWFVVHFESVRIEGICTHEEMYFEYMYTKCGQDSRLDEAA